jgi:hypothetical protein
MQDLLSVTSETLAGQVDLCVPQLFYRVKTFPIHQYMVNCKDQ